MSTSSYMDSSGKVLVSIVTYTLDPLPTNVMEPVLHTIIIRFPENPLTQLYKIDVSLIRYPQPLCMQPEKQV